MLGIKKKGYPIGTVRKYGRYGSYIKTDSGWKRIPQGYPKYRRTTKFKLIKSYLIEKGYGRIFINQRNTKQLIIFIKDEGLNQDFKKWLGGNDGKI